MAQRAKEEAMKTILFVSMLIGALATCLLDGLGGPAPDGEDRSAQVGDIKMGYRVFGNGDPLVMIMGYGSTMNMWESGLLQALSSRFKVIIFDNRGIGLSEEGERPISIEQFADDTAGLMEALGLRRAHVLGWSMGALIAEELALRQPGRVDRLVLYAAHCNAALFPPAPEILQKLTDTSGTPEQQGMRFISVLFPPTWLQSHGDRIKEVFYRPMGTVRPEIMGKQSMAIGAWKGCCDRLGQIKKLALIIAGAEDVLVPPQNARYLAGKIPGAKLALIENGGHGLMFQLPDEFEAQVTEFLAGK
jgi:pimeloyl-ACP methyl ester carboxylesterase